MAAMARWVRDTSRVDRTRTAAVSRRLPLDLPVERAGPQVQGSLVVAQVAVADIERLVVDQEPDELAVGDVHHALTSLGVAVGQLGRSQWTHLVKRTQVGAWEAVRIALVEVAAHADVAVGQGEHGFGLGHQIEMQTLLCQRPGLTAELGVDDHQGERSSSKSARSSTTRSAPCASRASA